MNPAVCIITPSLNPGRYFRDCLESVLAQGDIVQRHIVMDGGSTDGTVELLQDFARKSPALEWVSEGDAGQSDALQKALARVDTPYFGWLNADDFYFPGGVGRLLEEAQEHRSSPPSIVYGDYLILDADSRLVKMRRQPSFNYWECLFGYLAIQNIASLFNTQTAREVGGFDASLQFAMDRDLILRMAKHHPTRQIRACVGAYRVHRGTKTFRLHRVCKQEDAAIARKYSGCTQVGVHLRHHAAMCRGVIRMFREGCLWCRLGRNPLRNTPPSSSTG